MRPNRESSGRENSFHGLACSDSGCACPALVDVASDCVLPVLRESLRHDEVCQVRFADAGDIEEGVYLFIRERDPELTP